MLNVRLACDHLFGKLLFTWLSLVMSMMVSFVLSFFPRDVLDEILNLIESVSEDFPSYFNRKSLQTIYFTFIRPILEYADVVWNNCTQYEINELDKIQNKAARIVTGATKLVSINSLIKETGWETSYS